MGLALVLLATATAAYGVWRSVFAGEFTAREPYTGRAKYRYKPRPYQRVVQFAVSLTILIAGLAEAVKLWKSN
jgi:hypothetical protein